MKMKWKLQERNLYGFLAAGILTITGLFLTGPYFGVYEPTWPHLTTAILTCAFLSGFRFLKIRGRVVWGVVLLLTAPVCVLFYCGNQMRDIFRSYGYWLSASGEWLEEYFLFYQLLNTVCIAVFFFMFRLLSERYFVLEAAAGAALAGYFLTSMLRNMQVSHTGVVFGIGYLLLINLEYLRRQGRNKMNSSRMAALWLMPFLFLYLFLMAVIPARQEAFQWQFARDAYSKIREVVVEAAQILGRLKGGEDFGLSFSGFSDEGGSFGNLLEDDREVMQISIESSLRTNVYLIGKVSDTFDGREWIQTDDSAEQDRELDALETLYAVKRYGAPWQGNYLHQTKLQLTYRFFDTGYVFAPLKTLKMDGNALREGEPLREGGSLLFDGRRGYGTEYETLFLQMNLNHPGFYDMVKDQAGYQYANGSGAEEANRKLLHDLQTYYVARARSSEYVTEEELKQRAARIRDIYGGTVRLDAKVQTWLEEITAQARTDLEKLIAIEEALSGMTYTTTPGSIPDNADFLEYFLLEKKEGYCSYFATAFVLLARAEGIPARYVQGFCVPVGNQENAGISVRSNMAHAWPEVYLEGVGWIPFEPTPGYHSVRYTSWEMESRVEIEAAGGTFDDGLEHFAKPLDQEESVPKEEEAPAPETQRWFRLPVLLLYLFGTVVCCVLCLLWLDMIWNKKRYRHMSIEQKIRTQFRNNRNILTALGYPLAEGETLEELMKRVESGLSRKSLETSVQPVLFWMKYEEMIYGLRSADEELLAEVCKEGKGLMQILRLYTGKKYYWVRLRLYWANSRIGKRMEL